MFSAVIFSFESNTIHKDKKEQHRQQYVMVIRSNPGTNLSDLGESLFALVNEKLWPVNQVRIDLIGRQVQERK